MTISKKPDIHGNFFRPARFYRNARSGFKEFMREFLNGRSGKVLLPAYIGWSSNEGSGVFDPVAELKLEYVFYKVTDELYIDMEDVSRCLNRNDIALAVIIHYFGYVDPAYEIFISEARKAGVAVVEDEAHAMLSDLVGGVCGRLADVCIFSLHKLLPFRNGGMLVFNNPARELLTGMQRQSHDILSYFEYDLFEIARRRRENTNIFLEQLKDFSDEIDVLRPVLREGIVPQTLPVIMKNVPRDRLYNLMNSKGYGVVSLYHTLIKEIKTEEFPVSHLLSRKIINLPVHQDINKEQICGLLDCLKSSIYDLR